MDCDSYVSTADDNRIFLEKRLYDERHTCTSCTVGFLNVHSISHLHTCNYIESNKKKFHKYMYIVSYLH